MKVDLIKWQVAGWRPIKCVGDKSCNVCSLACRCRSVLSCIHYRLVSQEAWVLVPLLHSPLTVLQQLATLVWEFLSFPLLMPQYVYTILLENYPTDFFCENLVDFNETRLHEATLNLHIHMWIFSCLSIASVDGKQPLSEVVFSAQNEELHSLYRSSNVVRGIKSRRLMGRSCSQNGRRWDCFQNVNR